MTLYIDLVDMEAFFRRPEKKLDFLLGVPGLLLPISASGAAVGTIGPPSGCPAPSDAAAGGWLGLTREETDAAFKGRGGGGGGGGALDDTLQSNATAGAAGAAS